MDKSILSLMIIGAALAVLHVSHILLALGIIGCLAIATVKLFWTVLEAFSSSSGPTHQPTLTLSRSSVRSA